MAGSSSRSPPPVRRTTRLLRGRCGSPVGRLSCLCSRASIPLPPPREQTPGGLRGSGLSPPAPVDRSAFVAYVRRAAPAVLEPHREQNHSQLFRWCSRSASTRRAVNRRKSPRTERVPLDLFSRVVPDDDVLAVPSSGAQEQRSGSSANGGGAAQSHVCITAICRSDVRFHIR